MSTCTKCDFLEKDMKEVKTEIKDIYARLHFNEKSINGTEIKLNAIIQSIDELKFKLDKLTEAPARRWETVIGTGIAVIVTAILTYFLKG